MHSDLFQPENLRDQLSIDTPEQVALRFPLAGIGSRALANLIDSAIQFAFYLAMAILFALLARPIGRTMDSLSNRAAEWVVGLFILFNFMLVWGYYTCYEAFWRGQTPGKRAMKLRVLKDTGRQITFFEALTRNLMRLVDSLPGAYVAGIITMLISRENKRLGDLLAGTIVVHVQADEHAASLAPAGRTFTAPLVTSVAYATSPSTDDFFPQNAVARLSTSDLVLVESFAARTTELNHETSERLASDILARLCRTMQVAPPEGVSARRALDSIAINLRRVLAASSRG